MKKTDWTWMPHAGHLCVSNDCIFHLNTHVGGYIVSTVGEYFPDAPVREIFAQSRGVVLEGMGNARKADYMKKIGFEEIGCDRKYETLVFKAKKSKDKCCPWVAANWSELDGDAYNDAGSAADGHMKMCMKWAAKRK